MKNLFICIFTILLFSCENARFDSDKRQIKAKNEINNKMPKIRFDVTAFKEDTLQSWPDSNFKHPIRYTLDIVYQDSTNVLQRKKGIVLFTPDGNSIINSWITASIQ